MQIDFDVIKKITTVFLDSPEPFITLKELNFLMLRERRKIFSYSIFYLWLKIG